MTKSKSAKQVGPLFFRSVRKAASTVEIKAGPALLCVAGTLAALVFAAAPAAAEFGRPFIGQLTSSPTGPSGEAVPFSLETLEGGITTDAEDNVYVGNDADVEEFGSSGSFVRQISSPGFPGSLAFDDESGKLESGAGGHGGADVWVAADNSTGPTAGSVYFATDFLGGAAIRRMNKNGEPEGFTCTAEHAEEYVQSNELIGRSGEQWEPGSLARVAVDSGNGPSAGYIYAIDDNISASGGIQVDQFTPAGCFVRAFTAASVPEDKAFEGASLSGVAVDPTTGDVLIEAEDDEHQVIDEFTYTGEYLGKIAGVSQKDGFEYRALRVSGSALAVSSTGDLYVRVGEEVVPSGNSVAAKKTVIDEFGNSAFYPDVVTGEVTGAQPGSATLNGTVDGEGRGLEECRFQYISEAAFDADDVNAVQTVTLAGATGGTFSLASGGQSTGAEGTGDLVGPAEGSGEVFAGVNVVVDPVASKGTFVAGEEISGGGIAPGTTIVGVEPGFLVLSANVSTSGTVALSAISDRITAVETKSGAFAVGEEIVGAGIPAGTTIVEVQGATIALSGDITASGTGIALSSAIPYDATAGQVQSALQSLRLIGAGDVKVSGAEPTGSGGGPYTIEFTGSLAHSDVAELSGDASKLTLGGASVTVAVQAVGGDGWAHAGEAQCEPGANELKQEDRNQPVHAKAELLASGTVYLDRLIAATDRGEKGGVQEGEVASFQAPAAPLIEGVYASGVSSSFATLHAVVDPRGSDTSYRFVYSDGAGAGGITAPVDLGSGDRGASVEQQVAGLSPGTAYRFWVLASNGAGEVSGAGSASGEGAFSTAPSGPPALPDHRAYELVTPANKGDAEDLFAAGENFDSGYASEDGEHLILFTAAAFGPFPASGENAYVFSRGADGWSYRAAASPSLGVQSERGVVFDPFDFSLLGITESVGYHGEFAGSEERQVGLYGPPGSRLCEGGASSGCYRTVAAKVLSTSAESLRFVGASSDLSSVVAESDDHELAVCEGGARQALAETLDAGSDGLYEWSAARGCLSLLDVRSAAEGGGLESKCGAALGQGQDQAFAGVGHGAVSNDGSRVLFTAPQPEASGFHCWLEHGSETENPPQLYLRVNGETTVEISAPEHDVEPPTEYPAVFVGASADDSKVFFLTRSELHEGSRDIENEGTGTV